MNSPPKRIGSLFSLGPVSPDALPRLLHYVRHHASSRMSADRQRQIIEAWIGLCSESPDGIVDRDTLCEHIDITRPGLIHHLNALERLDLVSRSQRRPDAKRRRVVCYELRMPGKVTRAPEIPDLFDSALVGIGDADTARREEHDALQALFHRPDSVTCAPADLEKTTFKGERLTVFTLAPALNIGRQALTAKTTRIWRGPRSFVVTVRALAEHRIPNVHDLRPFVVAWTQSRDQLPHMAGDVPSQPVFVMSLRTICRQMGFASPTANNLRQTFNRLRRFRSSEWQLTDDRYNVLRTLRTGGMLERDKYMSFISDLEVISSVGAHGKTPEVIAVTFHPALTPVLTDSTRSLTLHKEFIQASTGSSTNLSTSGVVRSSSTITSRASMQSIACTARRIRASASLSSATASSAWQRIVGTNRSGMRVTRCYSSRATAWQSTSRAIASWPMRVTTILI